LDTHLRRVNTPRSSETNTGQPFEEVQLMEDTERTMKAPLTPDNTYSQYAEGVPPPQPTPRPLDAEDDAAIAAVVGETPDPGPGPEEREQLAQQLLEQQGSPVDTSGGPADLEQQGSPDDTSGGPADLEGQGSPDDTTGGPIGRGPTP
jgi:hypothetical protein